VSPSCLKRPAVTRYAAITRYEIGNATLEPNSEDVGATMPMRGMPASRGRTTTPAGLLNVRFVERGGHHAVVSTIWRARRDVAVGVALCRRRRLEWHGSPTPQRLLNAAIAAGGVSNASFQIRVRRRWDVSEVIMPDLTVARARRGARLRRDRGGAGTGPPRGEEHGQHHERQSQGRDRRTGATWRAPTRSSRPMVSPPRVTTAARPNSYCAHHTSTPRDVKM